MEGEEWSRHAWCTPGVPPRHTPPDHTYLVQEIRARLLHACAHARQVRSGTVQARGWRRTCARSFHSSGHGWYVRMAVRGTELHAGAPQQTHQEAPEDVRMVGGRQTRSGVRLWHGAAHSTANAVVARWSLAHSSYLILPSLILFSFSFILCLTLVLYCGKITLSVRNRHSHRQGVAHDIGTASTRSNRRHAKGT
jgi:hypothetical protein